MRAKIKFVPSGVEADANVGETVFEIGRRLKLPIQTTCVGKSTCGLCRVKICEGEQHLSAITDAETKHLGNVYFLTKVRLSCQAVIEGHGDVVVEVVDKKRTK